MIAAALVPVADLVLVPTGVAALSLIRPSPRTAGLGAMLEDLDVIGDRVLEERRRRLRRTLAEIASIGAAFPGPAGSAPRAAPG